MCFRVRPRLGRWHQFMIYVYDHVWDIGIVFNFV
ncbi:hypothetical protein F383_18630 [Gossypium arboreum]|uniref:Uncharacterized protein n=1 Tax=Gossypium arboreum TaxID=29729 RepID=A0A0B0NRM6_GOSAR|nr:hypothetical protein F383_18630 [Gossypium arboreum]